MTQRAIFLSFLFLVLGGVGCGRSGDSGGPRPVTLQGVEFSRADLLAIFKLSPLPANPPSPGNAVADREEAARFGQSLFFDPRLSANGQISCATCHDPARGWSDGRKRSRGLGPLDRNSPTLWNVAHNRWWFWDGRKDSLWSQSLAPLEHPNEMGGHRLRIYHLISGDHGWRAAYQSLFGTWPTLESQPVSIQGRSIPDHPKNLSHLAWKAMSEGDQALVNRVFVNAGKSMEAYERRIRSDNAPFDRFVARLRRGDSGAADVLSPEALRGLKLFVGRGQCTLCHLGPNFTDREFHNLGLDRGDGPLDTGRFEGIDRLKRDEFIGTGPFSDDRSIEANVPLAFVVRKPNNLGEFKTPTLRNVAETAPYMHDGRFADLDSVVDFYSNLDQVAAVGHREESLTPLSLTPEERGGLIAFLETLTSPPLRKEWATPRPIQ